MSRALQKEFLLVLDVLKYFGHVASQRTRHHRHLTCRFCDFVLSISQAIESAAQDGKSTGNSMKEFGNSLFCSRSYSFYCFILVPLSIFLFICITIFLLARVRRSFDERMHPWAEDPKTVWHQASSICLFAMASY